MKLAIYTLVLQSCSIRLIELICEERYSHVYILLTICGHLRFWPMVVFVDC